jgi:hypothetical protein
MPRGGHGALGVGGAECRQHWRARALTHGGGDQGGSGSSCRCRCSKRGSREGDARQGLPRRQRCRGGGGGP